MLFWFLMLFGGYLLLCLGLTYVVQEYPRNGVNEKPDWGRVEDSRIETAGGRTLEVWRIEPEGPSKGIVLLAHGWGRNRDRMVGRARVFGQWGYTTVLHSARDHGGSSPQRLMNAGRFAEDIEAVLRWIGEPVVLYGHSAGSVGAIIATSRHPSMVKKLLMEASYPHTQPALRSLYRWVNPLFGWLFGPTIVFLMNLFYRGRLTRFSPARLAPKIKVPVMLIHGANDRRFPLPFAHQLRSAFPVEPQLFIAPNAGHSDSSLDPEFPEAVANFLKT